MKKVVTVRIEVDMNNPECKQWAKPNEYFEEEVDEVVRKLTKLGYREHSKYSSEEGTTKAGNKFKIVQKKVR